MGRGARAPRAPRCCLAGRVWVGGLAPPGPPGVAWLVGCGSRGSRPPGPPVLPGWLGVGRGARAPRCCLAGRVWVGGLVPVQVHAECARDLCGVGHESHGQVASLAPSRYPYRLRHGCHGQRSSHCRTGVAWRLDHASAVNQRRSDGRTELAHDGARCRRSGRGRSARTGAASIRPHRGRRRPARAAPPRPARAPDVPRLEVPRAWYLAQPAGPGRRLPFVRRGALPSREPSA
jgi:hypothetical protein